MKRTQEQIDTWKANLKTIAGKVKALPADERAALAVTLGTQTCEGHSLSAYNAIMLYYQSGRALAMVGGFQQWKKAGRMVKKGQHAIGCIYVPLFRKEKEDAENDTSADRVDTGFKLVSVFDVEQTEEQQKQAE